MPKEKPSDKRAIIIVSVLSAFLVPFMAASLTVALPSIGREFSLPAVTLSWIITSYLLAIAVFLVPFGKAGDLYGRRDLFLYGTVLFTLSSLGGGIAASAPILIASRLLQGIGAAMVFGTGMAMLTGAIEPKKRGAMLGLNVAFTYLGLSLGPTLGGLLTGTFGWRSIFFITVPFGCAIVVFVLVKIKPDKTGTSREPFDYAGSIVLGAALVALVYGLSRIPNTGGVALSVAGALGLALFAAIESRTPSPVLTVALFRHNAVFGFSSLAALLNYSATHGAGFLMSLYLQYVKGLPPKHAGLIMMAQPLVMALCSPFTGKLSDRIEPRIVASLGMTLTALSLFMLSRVGATTPFGVIVAGLMLLGLGVAFFSSPNTSAIMGSVDKPRYGTASSIVGIMRLMGQMLSMSIAAVALTACVGKAPITPALHGAFIASVKVSFVVFGVLCTLGIFASLARGKVRNTGIRGNDTGSSVQEIS
jgi:EmrB/QacA subfamily drug resistance transporter